MINWKVWKITAIENLSIKMDFFSQPGLWVELEPTKKGVSRYIITFTHTWLMLLHLFKNLIIYDQFDDIQSM